MESILVDTALLAVPNYAVVEDVAHELFERIRRLSVACSASANIRIAISDQAEEDLWQHHCAPEREQIGAFLQLMNLSGVFTSHDLLKAYQTILSRAARVATDDGLEVRAIDYFGADPPLPAGLSPAALRTFTELSFSTLVALSRFDEDWNLGSALEQDGLELHRARAVLSEIAGDRAAHFAPLPLGVYGPVRLIRTPDDLLSDAQASRIWENAKCARDLHLAIAIRALLILRQGNAAAPARDLKRFSIGSNFLQTLERHQCAGGGRYSAVTLERCAQLVAGTGRVAIGTFGRPNQVQRRIDGALAHRVHLTGGGVGLRLMFWAVGNVYELANVGPKHELIIESGTPPSMLCDPALSFV